MNSKLIRKCKRKFNVVYDYNFDFVQNECDGYYDYNLDENYSDDELGDYDLNVY